MVWSNKIEFQRPFLWWRNLLKWLLQSVSKHHKSDRLRKFAQTLCDKLFFWHQAELLWQEPSISLQCKLCILFSGGSPVEILHSEVTTQAAFKEKTDLRIYWVSSEINGIILKSLPAWKSQAKGHSSKRRKNATKKNFFLLISNHWFPSWKFQLNK